MTTCTNTLECYVEKALNVIGGKWSFLVIKNLSGGTKRFGELKKDLLTVSPKTLTECLRSLEEHEILTRESLPTIPPQVKYTLTEKGKALDGIIEAMRIWGETWLK